MGAFDTVSAITIPVSAEQAKEWGWEPHEQVILKGAMTVADQKAIANNGGTTNKQGGVELRVGNSRWSILERMILRWTFMENGQSVPLTPENIQRLPSMYSTPILETCDYIAAPMSKEAQESFLHSANAPISASSE